MSELRRREDEEETIEGIEVHHLQVLVNGVSLHIVEAGAGPLVVLLHGFPENWNAWRRQIPFLVKSGFRVVTPDLRGYNRSDKPLGVSAYRLDILSTDISKLIIALGEKTATLVGHDWGGVIAWSVACTYPEQITQLVVINAPHPERYIELLWRTRQFFKSWYVFFFQWPWVPEKIIGWNRFNRVRNVLMNDTLLPNTFDSERIEAYISALSMPGALTAAINYYRAGVRYGFSLIHRMSRVIDCPTLILWGEKDRYLDIRLLDGLKTKVPHLWVERYPDATHWLIAEHPDRVNHAILQFLENTSE
jgi:pimeloyl-ACP methyl ester carboxylesterase